MSQHQTTIALTSLDETEEYTLVCTYSHTKGCKPSWGYAGGDPGWPDMIEDWSCRCVELVTFDDDLNVVYARYVRDRAEQIEIGNRVAALQAEQIEEALWADVGEWSEPPEYSRYDD